MFYKITNKESEIYRRLYELRKNEIRIEKENRAAVENIVGIPFKGWLGQNGQQNFERVSQYHGFSFEHPEDLPPKTWKIDKEHKDIYIPDRRTKAGRLIVSKLNSLQKSSIFKVFDIFNIRIEGRFGFPFVEICSDIIVLWMSDRFDDKLRDNADIIEITSREFEKLLDEELK